MKEAAIGVSRWRLVLTALAAAVAAALLMGWAGNGPGSATAAEDGQEEASGVACAVPAPPPRDGERNGDVTFEVPMAGGGGGVAYAVTSNADSASIQSAAPGDGDSVRMLPPPPVLGDLPHECQAAFGEIHAVELSPEELRRMDRDAEVIHDCAKENGVDLPPPPPGAPGHRDSDEQPSR